MNAVNILPKILPEITQDDFNKGFKVFGEINNKKIAIKYDKSKPNGTPRKVLDVSLAKKIVNVDLTL